MNLQSIRESLQQNRELPTKEKLKLIMKDVSIPIPLLGRAIPLSLGQILTPYLDKVSDTDIEEILKQIRDLLNEAIAAPVLTNIQSSMACGEPILESWTRCPHCRMPRSSDDV